MKSYGWIGALGTLVLYGLAFAIPSARNFANSWEWPALLVGYAWMTVLLLNWMNRAHNASALRFVTAVNGATAVKLLSSVAVVTVYLVAGGAHRVPFALGLFAAFAWNSARFVWVSQNLQRSKSPNPPPSGPH